VDRYVSKSVTLTNCIIIQHSAVASSKVLAEIADVHILCITLLVTCKSVVKNTE